MRSDRHYAEGETVPHYARKCAKCGRPFRGWGLSRFGSNACRQSAYRDRERERDRVERSSVTPRSSRNGRRRPLIERAPPSAEKPMAPPAIRNGKRFRGRQKGGAA